MNSTWNDLVGHHRWATSQLLAACRPLDDETLDATLHGTFGSIIRTLRHIINSEMSYLFRVTGVWQERPWSYDDPVSIDVLLERAALLADVLERFLAEDWDCDKLAEAKGDNGEIYAVPAGVILAQLIHHANEHRAHVCTILGSMGIEPPDVSAWGYADDTGRSTMVSGPVQSDGLN